MWKQIFDNRSIIRAYYSDYIKISYNSGMEQQQNKAHSKHGPKLWR